MENDNDNLLGSLGFVFPQNSFQLEQFDKLHANFEHKANKLAINPKRILQRIQNENVEVTGKDFHKRLVLAAEIVFRLKDDKHFGHLKLEKILYLCLNVKQISFHANFFKHAMGPYDPKMIRALDQQFRVNKWFSYNPDSFPKYSLLQKAGEHKTWFNRYFEKHLGDINYLIETFGVFTGDQIELVATIFESWKEIIEDGLAFDINLIIQRVYAWSEVKKKFSTQQIKNATSWMTEKGICPSQSNI
jgi:hypothetical protein